MDMAQTITGADVTTLPLAPKNPLPYWQRLSAARSFDTGLEKLRDAGGAVTRNVLGPNWTMPPLVFIASPQGARDVLGRTDARGRAGGRTTCTATHPTSRPWACDHGAAPQGNVRIG